MGVRDVVINFKGRDHLSRVARKNTREVRDFNRELDRTDRRARKTNRTLNKTQREIRQTGAAAKKHGKSMRGVGGVGLAGGFARGGLAATGAVASAALFTGKALSESAKVEMAITRIQSLFRTQEELDTYTPMVEDMIRELTRLGRPIEDVEMALFRQVSMAGASAESFKRMRSGAKLAIGGFAELGPSVGMVNKLLENFPELAGDAEKAANIIFTGQVFGDTDIAQMGARLPNVMALAASQGMTAKETVAMLAVLTRRQGSTGKAATAMEGLILALSQSTKASREVLQDLDVPATFQEFNELGIEETLRRLRRAATEAPELLRQIIPEKEALTAAAAMSDAVIDEMAGIQDAMQADIEGPTGLDGSYQRVMDTMSVKTSQAREAVNELAASFGDNLAPSVKRNLDQFTEFARIVNDEGWLSAFNRNAVAERRSMIAKGIMKPEDFRPGTDLGTGSVEILVGAQRGTLVDVTRSSNGDRLNVGTQVRGQ